MAFTKNLVLYYVAIGVILAGYALLSIGGADSLTSLTLGPIVLVVGYLVAMPIALLRGVLDSDDSSEPAQDKKSSE